MGTARPSLTSVMRLSSGWTPTSLPRWKSSTRSRRRWRVSATQSSPSCMPTLAEPQEEFQEAWVAHLVLVLLEELAVLDPPLRRWTNLPNAMRFAEWSNEVLIKNVKTKPSIYVGILIGRNIPFVPFIDLAK